MIYESFLWITMLKIFTFKENIEKWIGDLIKTLILINKDMQWL